MHTAHCVSLTYPSFIVPYTHRSFYVVPYTQEFCSVPYTRESDVVLLLNEIQHSFFVTHTGVFYLHTHTHTHTQIHAKVIHALAWSMNYSDSCPKINANAIACMHV
jgi:hypothetical protein